MKLNKRPAPGTRCFVLVDVGRVVDGYWTVRAEAQREASSRNDLPEVVEVQITTDMRLGAVSEVK